MKILIKYNAKPLMAVNNSENGTTALHLAIKSMNANVETLLDYSASVSIVDKLNNLSSLDLNISIIEIAY